VIHRPDMHASVEWAGRTRHGYGYSKRYYGDYPRHWGYRFIHGVGVLAPPSGSDIIDAPTPGAQPTTAVWTADATFGDHKYNYYKLIPDVVAGTPLVESETQDTWQIGEAGYALVDGIRHNVAIEPLCSWSTVITDESRSSDSKMENRLCKMVITRGDEPPVYGLAYNERCYGTVG